MADNDFATGYAIGQNDSNHGCYGGGWGNGMFGDGGWIFLILILALMGGGWGGGLGGFGGAGLQGMATRADINTGFQFNDLQNGIRGIQQGLCDGFYAMNTGMLNGFHGVDNAICNLGYQVQQGFNTLGYQQKDCCCETQRLIERGFCDTNYNAATNTSNIIQAGHCDTDRVIAKLNDMEAARQQEKIEALRLENQSLRFSASQDRQNAYITTAMQAQTNQLIDRIAPYPVPSFNVCAPYNFGGYAGNNWGGWGNNWGGWNRSDGCGCGCGCGCAA